MKKLLLMCLLISTIGIISSYGETWEQYIRRAETMTRNFGDGINSGHWNPWGIDKWGALLATTHWLETAYESIYKNAPNLSQQERDIYFRLWQRRITQSEEMIRLIRLANFTNNTIRSINSRWEYWAMHLFDGGTITFN